MAVKRMRVIALASHCVLLFPFCCRLFADKCAELRR